MTYKVLSSLTANNVNSADILKVKTDLLIIGVNKKTSSASELKDLKSSSNSMIGESMNEINNGTRKSIFLPAPAKVGAKNILLIKEPEVDAASFLVIRHFEEIMGMI
ncbi:MAG: leucyl aminopeptidase, partial [SAR86 cluster bacterium]|nr:leucyl aminopeptidase [SAR86 cluster bacterium]